MLFNSSIFILGFLPLTLLIFWLLSKFRLTQGVMIWLLLSSLFFYSYWNIFAPAGQGQTIQYIILIVLSIVINHQLGSAIASAPLSSPKAKLLLFLGTCLNLGVIVYYKYANFLLGSFNHIFASNYNLGQLILPLGISFYTFTQIAYLVDAYRGEIKEENYELPTYGLFILFFPQLIAGPILRHDELIPQFRRLRNFIFSSKNLALGLTLFSLGLSKKVIIADTLSPWVGTIFAHANSLTFIEAWVGALSYTLQLYFDFSGYSDMAIGLGLMFNIILPINFDSPYKSLSIIEFWRRWHITLSNFLRDYLYIPLGGSRRGEIRRYTNLIVTMLLGGLWHGAGWTFVVWGGLHGLYLSINHGWKKLNITFPKWLAWIITFLAVVMGWVIFRAQNLSDGLTMIQTMIGINGITLPGEAQGKLSFLSSLGIQLQSWSKFNYLPEFYGQKNLSILILFVLVLGVVKLPNSQEIMEKIKFKSWWALVLGLLMTYCLLSLNRVSEFLYFQF
ncbi:MBOAT family O-acyltransferase [Crocosphaera sp. XPORK-15E]|uniref:MBOAT family O-acyltransferase n=1 Tax=Crocosphaera sp. XPORK-15E TaxID=3110247 RepID=UPI002B1EE3AE|nr:MBOAT family O-acyltransferase [Crocosphaera sp. XPORK-15E]MEA5536054.1 MBOAT family O-acyltransferase [Crocosphaera sp. XPORK-15E]